MQTIYLSGASSELTLCESYRDKLLEQGWTITRDWMQVIRDKGGADAILPVRDQRRLAIADLEAVREAQIFWLLLPTPPLRTIGAWVELGFALGLDPRHDKRPFIMISGTWCSIFYQLADERFDSHDKALSFVQKSF